MTLYRVYVEYDFFVESESNDEAALYATDVAKDISLFECADVVRIPTPVIASVPMASMYRPVYGTNNKTLKDFT